jgi:TRAP-type C4-dicarboxylate transport system permease small subunit
MHKPFFPKLFNTIFDRILDITVSIAGLLLVFQMLSVCLEVVLRYFFNSPTIWVVEITSYMVLLVPFLSGAYVLKKGAHVRMDLLIKTMRSDIRLIFFVVTSLIAMVVCLVVTWYGIKVVADLYQTGFRTQTFLMLPKWPIISIIPLGTLLFFIEFMRQISSSLSKDNES